MPAARARVTTRAWTGRAWSNCNDVSPECISYRNRRIFSVIVPMHQNAVQLQVCSNVYIEEAHGSSMDRSYQAENARSRPLPEAKLPWASPVVGWVTTCEPDVTICSFAPPCLSFDTRNLVHFFCPSNELRCFTGYHSPVRSPPLPKFFQRFWCRGGFLCSSYILKGHLQ